ncbi:NlpC/P60 family protein [uncultured Flavobacterium sp.]|uniref:C40 family peptidase n=1 Tax=uncultured Flavobacterium sp. TaxID=165435 RepID=UPI0025FED316|nr:NlpC/P60 family protein [uncultured Flavobacterium sp.]
MRHLRPITLILFLIASFSAKAQIVTSKKEAQKKGIYSYTEKAAPATSPAAKRTAVIKETASLESKDFVAFEPVQKKEIIKGQGKPEIAAQKPKKGKKNLKHLLTDTADPDFQPENDNYLALQIVNNALDFVGVRYRAGGTSRDGMDCSGMVFTTFKIFDITLPRSSRDMAGAGQEVKLSEVKKGDLLLFKNSHNSRSINHVGIVSEVTDEGEVLFVHSSTSSGVIVSSMNEAYHSRTFVQANRVIEN